MYANGELAELVGVEQPAEAPVQAAAAPQPGQSPPMQIQDRP
jgi:hypothetical protein